MTNPFKNIPKDISKAARLLDWGRNTITRKLKDFHKPTLLISISPALSIVLHDHDRVMF
ncbi:hypothetical protein GEA64_00610 [Photorhabdus khanii]|uniref:DNA binding HTH domain-containing protein n=1 Tax=Photorhabdus khanii TaxID=1004150 RepID=A0A7C9KD83_9GAMM|nr:hypothetical protein [Photorhabdus khanii]